jgi:hypothetical protein
MTQRSAPPPPPPPPPPAQPPTQAVAAASSNVPVSQPSSKSGTANLQTTGTSPPNASSAALCEVASAEMI